MSSGHRFGVLDGWRALSIILVLICHLFPVGPKSWHFQAAVGIYGMSLFFILSGFLVTHLLLDKQNVVDFLIRRFFRIIPLAWLYMLVVLLIYPVSRDVWAAHFLFYANYPPRLFIHATDHLWSLCVEIHFYIGVALLVGLFKKRGLLLIPAICIFVTLLRMYAGAYASGITHLRIDDILAGGILALVYHRQLGSKLPVVVSWFKPVYLIPLLLIASHPDGGWMNYFRPYLAALLVGTTLYNNETPFAKFLTNRVFTYIAAISFAVYVFHPLLASSLLGSGGLLEKYSKRPLLIMVTVLVAHISTFYYERYAIELGRKLSSRLLKR